MMNDLGKNLTNTYSETKIFSNIFTRRANYWKLVFLGFLLLGVNEGVYAANKDSCGVPTIDRGKDGIYLWQVCPTKQWRVEAVGGKVTRTIHAGDITSNQSFTSLTRIDIDANDALKFSRPDRIRIVYELNVWRGELNKDKFGFEMEVGADAVFYYKSEYGPVYVGQNNIEMNGPFSLNTLESRASIAPILSLLLDEE